MREKKKSNEQSQQILSDKETEVLRQAVEIEYTTLFRQLHKTTQKTARHILRHVVQHSPPRALSMPIPISTLESNVDESEDATRIVSVSISDGVNKKSQTNSTIVTMMPTLPRVRELISYVPTAKNVATRGHLIGIPYLGDKFDDEDQQLINSISIEPSKQRKLIRKKKLEDQSLENLFESIRLNKAWNAYSNDQIIDAILHYHRDSTPRARLVAFATQNNYCMTEADRHAANVDTCENVDADLDDLVIKPWCSRFCPRCYTYNCLLHKDKTQFLPLPKQIFIPSDVDSSVPCSSTCYKHQREHLKRPLSPSRTSESHSQRHSFSIQESFEQVETVKKRRRKSTPIRIVNSTSALAYQHQKHNENVRINETITADIYLDEENYHLQKKMPPQFLSRIENHMKNHVLQQPSISQPIEQQQQQIWTLTNRSIFRLLYFLVDGDLCLLSQIFDGNQTCYEIYQQWISDARYFADLTTKELRASAALFSLRRPYRRRMPDGSTRAFLYYMKKHGINRTKPNHTDGTSTTLKPAYEPCSHEGPCVPGNSLCRCAQMGTLCEKYCNCSVDCPHRFPGCACKGSCLMNSCLCVAQGRECDPDLCHKCGASLFVHSMDELDSIVKSEPEVESIIIERKSMPSTRNNRSQMLRKTSIPQRQHSLRVCRGVEPSYKETRERRSYSRPSSISDASRLFPTITCANISLQRKIHKQILVAESDVAGYGAFLGSTSAQPGDLIAEYTGEIISEAEADRRGRLYDKQACSYLFNLDMQHCIDARQFGNKLRFANHSSRPNCVPKIKLVNGDYRIGIYAKQIINQGDELFFEYMYDAHQRQQYVNNERIDDEEQDGLVILARFIDNAMLVRPSID